MGAVAVRVSRPAAAVLAPLLVHQGQRVRTETPVLPEASGARRGSEGTGLPVSVVVVGESTAAGVGVATQDQGLARHLAVELARLAGRRVHWRLAARGGATAGHTLRVLVPEAAAERSDVAVVVLGVNDALKIQSLRSWRHSITGVIEALALSLGPAGVVVLAGVPPVGSFPALPQPLRAVVGLHARALDRALRQIAADLPAVVHSPVPAMTGPRMLAADGFHPSAEAYQHWAAHLAAAVHAHLHS